MRPPRHDGKHDWYTNEVTKQSQPVPRHKEINERLANAIIKKLRGE
jgi:YcfA-like protein.